MGLVAWPWVIQMALFLPLEATLGFHFAQPYIIFIGVKALKPNSAHPYNTFARVEATLRPNVAHTYSTFCRVEAMWKPNVAHPYSTFCRVEAMLRPNFAHPYSILSRAKAMLKPDFAHLTQLSVALRPC